MDELPVVRSDNYVLLTVSKLWGELPQIILGGLFFSILAVPTFVLFSLGWISLAVVVSIVTVAPAWTALLAYEFALWGDRVTKANLFWITVQKYWWRSVGLGCMAAFPLLAALLKLPLLSQTKIPAMLWLSFAADFFAGGLLAALHLYTFPLMVRNDLGLRQTVRNAWLLMGRYLIHTVGLLGMGTLLGLAVGSLSLGLLFLLPAIYGLFVVGNCELVLQKEKVL